nr:hypothetical protein [Tanacetum cinerariifolium]
MVAYLSKSDASKGFNQLINFLNGSSIKVGQNGLREAICQAYVLQSILLKPVEVVKERDDEVNVSDADEGDVSTAHGEVLTVAEEPSIPSPTPPTLPPQPSQDIPSTSQLITEVVTAASETITAASTNIIADEAQVPAATTAVTLTAAPTRVTAAPSRRKKGVVIRDLQEESTTSTIIHAKTKSKEKDEGILTEAQARKNMIGYLKIVVGFKMDYFKGMSYDDIHPIFEAKFNINVAFLLKTKERIEEDENRALKKLNETLVERAAKRKKLDEELDPPLEMILGTLKVTRGADKLSVGTGTSCTNILGTKEDLHQAVKEKKSLLRFIALLNWFYQAQMATSNTASSKDDAIPVNNAP